MKKYNLAIVGATGMVGNKFIQILEERKLPVENYYLFASSRSAGKTVTLLGKDYTIIELIPENIVGKKIDFAIFSAGGSVSKEFAPLFVKEGAVVIDNSSYWRMDKDVPLIVPEVNGEVAFNNKGIIANPNCSTTQAVVPLKALHDAYKIKRVVFSTYQAVSGAGVQGYNDLANGTTNKFIYPIKNNLIPHIDVFLPNGYTKEEWKMIEETKKILNDYSIKITATTVRVPVFHGHSESVNVEFEKPCTLDGIREALKNMPGVIVLDKPNENLYPMPIYAEDKDDIFVGRIRLDDTVKSGCNIWIVSDNIRKGAATNTIQIAEYMMKHTK